MWIGHCKEIRKLTFRALALRRSESELTLETWNYWKKIMREHTTAILNDNSILAIFPRREV